MAAVILLIVGPYVALYGIWEIQVERGSITPWIDDVITTADNGLGDALSAESEVPGVRVYIGIGTGW